MRTAAALGCLTALGTSAAAAALLYALLRRRGGGPIPADPATRVSRSLQAEYGDLGQLVPQEVLAAAAGFHSRLVEICRLHTENLPSYQRRVLDVLSGTGRVSLELSGQFEQVVGVEPDRDLLQHAQQLRQFGHCVFSFSEEGGPGALPLIAKAAASTTSERVEFWPEDPCRLPADFSQFGCVLVANTLTRLSSPVQFLATVHRYIVTDGCLVIASSYDWASSCLDKSEWLCGGEDESTFYALQTLLEPHFECVSAKERLCRLLPLTLRTFTLSLPEVSVWRRKHDREQV